MKFNLIDLANKFAIAQRHDESDNEFIARIKEHHDGVIVEISSGFRIHLCRHCTQMINEHDTTCAHCGEGQ